MDFKIYRHKKFGTFSSYVLAYAHGHLYFDTKWKEWKGCKNPYKGHVWHSCFVLGNPGSTSRLPSEHHSYRPCKCKGLLLSYKDNSLTQSSRPSDLHERVHPSTSCVHLAQYNTAQPTLLAHTHTPTCPKASHSETVRLLTKRVLYLRTHTSTNPSQYWRFLNTLRKEE